MTQDTEQTNISAPDEGLALSRRFLRNLVWALVICSFFAVGQGIRYYHKLAQLDLIQAETTKLYTSVLGQDIGSSPFGRLQFEQGKLSANLRMGLDPLSVLTSLSRPAVESLRLESLSIDGMRGKVRAFFGPNVDGFDVYLKALSDDDNYFFTLERREDVFGGVLFSLIVEPK